MGAEEKGLLSVETCYAQHFDRNLPQNINCPSLSVHNFYLLYTVQMFQIYSKN